MSKETAPSILLALLCTLTGIVGCNDLKLRLPRPPGEKVWSPTDYFDSKAALDLCDAISAQDVNRIEELIKQGTDVNIRGKSDCTPLMWALACGIRDDNPAAFETLLRLGADPNVTAKPYVKLGKLRMSGTAVIHQVICVKQRAFFDAAIKNHGEPDLLDENKLTPLHILCMGAHALEVGKSIRRLEVLLGHEADTSVRAYIDGGTPAIEAITSGNVLIAVELFKRGANPVLRDNTRQSAAHYLLTPRGSGNTPADKAAVPELKAWLERHGISLQVVQEDLDRWAAQAKDYRGELGENGRRKQEDDLAAERDKVSTEIWQRVLAEEKAQATTEPVGTRP